MNNNNEFRFVAYLSPPQKNVYTNLENPDCITDEHYLNMLECGFNYAIGLFEDKEEFYHQALKMCEKHGVKYFVRDQFDGKSIEWMLDNRGKDGTTQELINKNAETIKMRFSRYNESPAFFGVLASDEPCADKFPAIRKIQDWFFENFPGKEFEVNLLPTYASPEQLSGFPDNAYSYEQYLNDYVNIVKPKTLSYDFYALVKNPDGSLAIRADYLYNLELIANKAKELNVPFYVFLLTIGHWCFRTITKYSEMAWQIYSAMAYGCSGAQTFTYWTLLGDHENDGSKITHGVVGQNGEKTETYYACKQAIAEVRTFEKVYSQYNWVGCRGINADAANPNPMTSLLKTQIASHGTFISAKSDADILLGFFEKDGGTAILISNINDPTLDISAKVELKVSADTAEIYHNSKHRTDKLNGGVIELNICGGGGAFITFKA